MRANPNCPSPIGPCICGSKRRRNPDEQTRKRIVAAAQRKMREIVKARERLAAIGTIDECAAFDKMVGAAALVCILTPMVKR